MIGDYERELTFPCGLQIKESKTFFFWNKKTGPEELICPMHKKNCNKYCTLPGVWQGVQKALDKYGEHKDENRT